jgi:DNA (cytosine-5)-methyltransferase 1
MNYLSVCSGIEAATVAWHSLGWTPLAFSEIEKFPSQVLAHHYPNTPNLGDMTRFKEWNFESDVNVLVGGTPCQSFSVAGLRKGLYDPRGNLMLTYLAIAAKYRPKWLVWENVPGVLSSNGGLDFASLLRGMGELGYGFAYRVLDAQYFGVAQRRRRVFVVGYLGNWRPAAAVLFERHSLQGHPAPSREKREGVAPSTGFSVTGSVTGGFGPKLGTDEACQGSLIPAMHSEISPALKARDAKGPSSDGDGDGAILVPMSRPIALQDVRAVEKMQNGKGWNDDGTAYTVDTHATQGVAQPINIYGGNKRQDRPEGGFYVRMDENISKTLDSATGLNPTCSQGGTAVMQPIPFDTTQITSKANYSKPQAGDPCHPLAAGAHPPAITQAMAFDWQSGGDARGLDPKPTAQLQRSQTPAVMQAMAVRRLTPVECERLQGFPDNYTDIQPKGKATPDGPRYKALGNSMAVPVMAWIGERIAQVEGIA